MYVDESGDVGIENSPTKYYILSGLVFHELRWATIIDSLISFRRYLRIKTGLKLREEIHSAPFINRPGELKRIPRNIRFNILKQCLKWTASNSDIRIITIVTDKSKYIENNIFEITWKALIQRYENTISHRNFPGPKNSEDKGIVLSDNTDGDKLIRLFRKMKKYNPISNNSSFDGGYRNLKLKYIIEDPIFRDSRNSYLHQMLDVIAYSARQLFEPNAYVRKKGGKNWYKSILKPVVLSEATKQNEWGIVML